MARSGRPASESYLPVCYSSSQSISFSSGSAGPEDEEDRVPIFSLSKSSMDVVMATGPPHKRDPAWTSMDLRRSSSTNTHSEQNSVTLRQLHPHVLQHINAANSHQLPLTAQNVDLHSPLALSDRWLANTQRWSKCSSSTHSRSSTPETIVWKDRTSRPSSLVQETPYSPALDSSFSRLTSQPATPSPFISPLQSPSLPHADLPDSPFTQQTESPDQQNDLLVSSPAPSPLISPGQAHASSPLEPNSPGFNQPTSAEDEGFPENNSLTFTFPSPIPSSASLAEGAAPSDPGQLANDAVEEPHSPGGVQLLEGEAAGSPIQMPSPLTAKSAAEGQEPGREASACYLGLPYHPMQSCPTGRGWRTPLVASVSDSRLGECCRCTLDTREDIAKVAKVDEFREEGTMTTPLELVDAAVQTTSPVGSLWGLRRDVSASNMGSHSILGSPPGSRLNLKSSVGSHSNLVSPSSSMFPASSEEEEEDEEERQRDERAPNSASSHYMERRRSCLKTQGFDRDELGRRSSMKQVQWDEDGMTWDVHGACLDPEVLTTAIKKHLELQDSPQPPRRSSKKKKAPKPPVISKATTPELDPPAITASTATAEGKKTSEGGRGKEATEDAGGKTEERVAAARRLSRADGDKAKEEDEVYREEGSSTPNSPSLGSGPSRKRSVIRALRKPRWCGSSKSVDD